MISKSQGILNQGSSKSTWRQKRNVITFSSPFSQKALIFDPWFLFSPITCQFILSVPNMCIHMRVIYSQVVKAASLWGLSENVWHTLWAQEKTVPPGTTALVQKKRAQGLEVRKPCNLKTLCLLSHDPSETHFTLQNRIAIPMLQDVLGGLFWNSIKHNRVLFCPFCIFRKAMAPYMEGILGQELCGTFYMCQPALALYNSMRWVFLASLEMRKLREDNQLA